MKKEINIPELSLVVLIGTSGAGKSTFARKHFEPYEIVSSDQCRAIVGNDENNMNATNDAFELLRFIVSKRLKNGLLTVIDATNVQKESRKSLVELAKEFHCLPVAIVLDIPEKVCQERNAERSDRNLGKHVIRQQKSQLRKSLRNLKHEGFRNTTILGSEAEVDSIENVKREKLYNDKKDVSGPFDIIGDIHGCYTELFELLNRLGYQINETPYDTEHFGFTVTPPTDRKAIFLGDLVDRGPDSPKVLKLVMSMVNSGVAYCVPGNHDLKLQKFLNGKNVTLNHGLELTVEQLQDEPQEFLNVVKEFLYALVSHLVFDNGKLVVAHAGIKEEMQGRGSGAVRSFCLYGETTGEIDEFGLPVRYNWASEYRGRGKVVYGHTPVPDPQWLNNTIDIDTGCVFGGKLTALKYPEEEIVSVDAKEVYCEPVRPIHSDNRDLSHQHEADDILDIQDVTGKRFISTRLRNNISIQEENSIAALEVMSRFAVNPKWLIYLPPTMSPSETSKENDWLEHPQQAFDYYKKQGVSKVICEEKHMGSRVVIIVCKNEDVVRERFGITNEGIGVCYTRTGRNFFNDDQLENQFLNKARTCLDQADFWNRMNTDWVCLDAELMPWSAKAQSLLKDQYASVGTSATASIESVLSTLEMTQERGIEGIDALKDQYLDKIDMMSKYKSAYRNYCWTVNSIEDYKLAPFHILATEGQVYFDKSHEWHMQTIQGIAEVSHGFIIPTPYKIVDLQSDIEVSDTTFWWEDLTSKGGEGMVMKPFEFTSFGKKGVVQPAIKCRGKEYLRIIYGPEYTSEQNMTLLRKRSVGTKRSLAIREFALGIEGLERFVSKMPLRKTHECVFGVLALESEEVDPRL